MDLSENNRFRALKELDKEKDFIDEDLFNFSVEHDIPFPVILHVQIIRELKKLNKKK